MVWRQKSAHLKGLKIMALEDRPRGCPETSVRNYHYTLRNNPEERSSHILRGWSLMSCSFNNFHISLHLVRTDWWQLSLCFTLLIRRTPIFFIRYIMYWTLLLIIQYACTEPKVRFTAIPSLSTSLTSKS
jgi:hypothetical protein